MDKKRLKTGPNLDKCFWRKTPNDVLGRLQQVFLFALKKSFSEPSLEANLIQIANTTTSDTIYLTETIYDVTSS
ncbi:hypothetical protein HAT2_00651 [Candidatus Similichlamydia laticola]|uniref:Uncharacterized protein n=1 Tax=Candidatus Similichlamydia laticola TaxID=2170265 RepID=A0A369KJU0_9BACT|nr:hypothetical protein HAT2_00651 [Candidatus Similichlamydia laticola]